MAAKKLGIEWVTALPITANLTPLTIYFVKPAAGVKPGMFITDLNGNITYQINPDVDTSSFLKSVNGIQGVNGNVNVDLAFNATTGVLSFTGGTQSINFDARYVTKAEFGPWQTTTDNRLSSLEAAMVDGMRAPKPFDASTATQFPTAKKGDTYKVTVAGTVQGVKLEVGDTLIYDADGNTPYVLQTNVDKATTTIAGLIRIATQAEVNETVVGNLKDDGAVTPLTLYYKLQAFAASLNVPTAATQQEVTDGVVTNKYVNPATLKVRIAALVATTPEVTAGLRDDVFITPKKLQERVGTAVAQAHTHTNKTQLDKIGEDAGGNMTYGGLPVFTLNKSEW